ncbi:hypothetical protein NSU18_08925 [Paenibacillus sp. FSL H8-0048]|uniref:hypothetical protein n=1 Tax=Paenibacillus sp. FSL H8-0048 TaxID=2954508 RepID=UPI0030FD12C2
MKKALVVAILSIIVVVAVFQMDTYSDARGKPATPAEVLKFANEDYLDLYGVKDYFKEETSKGSYRKDLLQKRIASGAERYYEIVYGTSHGIQLDGGIYEYSGYTREGNSVPTENVPWFAGWSGTQIQNLSLIKESWEDDAVQQKFKVNTNKFDRYQNTNNPKLTAYLTDGTFEQAIIEGLNFEYGGNRTYKDFMYRNQNKELQNMKVYTNNATPSKGGKWIDYVHVLQPPTYFSWGYGTVYISHNSGNITYLDIPIAPLALVEQEYDLKAEFEQLPLQAEAGEQVQVQIRVNSSFLEEIKTPFRWEIIQVSTGKAIDTSAAKLTFTGQAQKGSGELVIPKNGERLLKASFKMPDSEVRIKFSVNPDGKAPKEKQLANNVLDSHPIAVKLLKPQPLGYNVLTRQVEFPIYGGAPLVAQLYLPRGKWINNATGQLHVTNATPDVFRQYKVSNNDVVNDPGSRISRQPIVSAVIDRKDFGDDPEHGKWLNPANPYSPAVKEGRVEFQGGVQRTYEYDVTSCSNGTCTTKKETGTATASFPQGTDRKLYEMYFYHGRKEVPEPVVDSKIEQNTGTALSKKLLWRTEPYPVDVIRWMYHLDKNNQAYQAVAVNGQYKRTFTQQGMGDIAWSADRSQRQEYQTSRTAAKEGQAGKAGYDKAVFATDRELQRFNYPVKSGYYFNPAGSYSFKVKTVVYKPVKDDTEDHKELVQRVIDSFRYENDLIYINNKKIAVNLSNEPLAKQGGGFARKTGVLTAKNPKGVNGEVLLAVMDRSTDSSRYSKKVVELEHSQDVKGDTHEYWKKVMEGYSQSSTAGSNKAFEYKEFVKNGQSMYQITEETRVTIVVNPKNSYLYTHANMADGEYPIKVSVGNVELGKSKLAYRTLGSIEGITALDCMTITVKGSMFDDLNN